MTSRPLLLCASLLAGLGACSTDCGPDQVAAQRRALGPTLQECGSTTYSILTCDTSAAATTARDCFAQAAAACKPAHLYREQVLQGGRTQEDAFVVPAGGGCKLHVVQRYLVETCADPVILCDTITPTHPGPCGVTSGLNCSGGYE